MFSRAVAGGEYVTVPNVVGESITQASFELGELGLELGKQTGMPSDQFPRYHVIAQRPAAGKVVRAGRKIYPTVSTGRESVAAPDLAGMPQAEAIDAVGRQFKLGTVARMPSAAPRDTVIAQEPRPGKSTAPGAEINMLLSAGSATGLVFMPNIAGKSIEEAVAMLTSLNVKVVPRRVDAPEAAHGVVLAQDPPPGTVIGEGDTVTYEIRGEVKEAPERHKADVTYVPPFDWFEHDLRIDVVSGSGVRKTVFPAEKDREAGLRPTYQAGQPIHLTITFSEEITVEVYVDNQKVRSYYYEGDAEAVITDYNVLVEGDERAQG